jgi:hypothetical protein
MIVFHFQSYYTVVIYESQLPACSLYVNRLPDVAPESVPGSSTVNILTLVITERIVLHEPEQVDSRSKYTCC